MKKLILALALLMCITLIFTSCDLSEIGDIMGNIGDFDLEDLIEGIGGSPNSNRDEEYSDRYWEETEIAVNRPEEETTGKEILDVPSYGGDQNSVSMPRLVGNDYGGEEILICHQGGRNPIMSDSGAQRLDVILYQRELRIEEMLNVDILYENYVDYSIENFFNQFRLDVMTGDKNYDLVYGSGYYLTAIATEGFLEDWNDTSVDLNNGAWYEDAMSQFTTPGGHLHVLAGDGTYDALLSSNVMFFNEDIIENYNMSSPYTLVRNGDWTLENMFSMAFKVENDISGDGITDSYGFIGNNISDVSALFCTNTHSLEYQNGAYQFTIGSDRVASVFEQNYMGVFSENAWYSDRLWYAGSAFEDGITMFLSGNALFYTDQLFAADNFSEMNYGVVPFPKADEDTGKYTSYVNESAKLLAAVVGNYNMDVISDVVDLFGYYGSVDVMPEVCSKYVNNAQGTQGIMAVRNSLFFDLAEFGICEDIRNSAFSTMLNPQPNGLRNKLVSLQKKVVTTANYWSKAIDEIYN